MLPNVTNLMHNIYLYDRLTGSNTLMSASAFGAGAGDSISLLPSFSVDAQTVAFQSWSSDLVTNDFNGTRDLFTLKLYTADPTDTLVGQIVLAPAGSKNPTLTWPAVSGKNYAVQFKNNLTDAYWQELNASVTVSAGQGSATDTTPNPGQRFYRVISF
jgi:hypothetical protein